MTVRSYRSTAGTTMYELVVAILLLGIAVHPLVNTLSSTTRIATDRQGRLDAERLLRNEVALLSSADPELVADRSSYRSDRSGREVPGGDFKVAVQRSVRCGVGTAPSDNAAAVPVAGCSAGGVVIDYAVAVAFSRAAGRAGSDTVSHAFSVASSAPHGGGAGGPP